jgi:WhiB family redox-sensing transcriptional regulator
VSPKHVAPPSRHGVARPWVDTAGGPSPTELRRSRWQDQGACANRDTEAWFVRSEGSSFGEPAKQICTTCPVRRDCLAASLVFGERFGIWGGLDSHQRSALAQSLRRGAPLGAVLDHALGDQSSGMDAA